LGKDSTHWAPEEVLQERLNGFRDKVITLLTKALLEAENWVQDSWENIIQLPRSRNDSALTLTAVA